MLLICEMCANKNYVFIDVHKAYADDEGFLNKNLSDGNVHIKNPGHLIAELVSHGLF